MRSPAWFGDWPISAGEFYSSGSYHGSWDVAMPTGTALYAPVTAEVLDLATGVPNTPGGPGSPSNWLTIGFHDPKRGKVSLYYQHLSRVTAHKGQKLCPGDKVGESGNSGNSSGPHLHLTYQPGWRYASDRYAYTTNHTGIYPPSKAWEDQDMPLTSEEIDKIARRVWEYQITNTAGDGDNKPARWYLPAILDKAKGH